MNRFLIFLLCAIYAWNVNAQNDSIMVDTTINRTDSLLVEIKQQLNSIEYRIRGLDRYKIYPTENMYNLLKLDTMTGQLYQVQWNLDDDKEFESTIISTDLSYNTGCGTFELYPTQNMYQFLLLDKVSGRVWHVQWGLEPSKRWYQRIY